MRKLVVIALLLAAGCMPKPAPVVTPAAPKYTDFLYPAIPAALQASPEAASIDRGWRLLQADDAGGAEKEFAAALKRTPAFYPAHAGQAYAALARRNYDKAVSEFDAALKGNADYVPALVGRGQALLALNRDADALQSFEHAVAVDASLTDLRSRIDVLRFRTVQDVIARARAAAAAGRLDEARTTYERALGASPDSAFLYHELADIERRQGNVDQALEHFRRAVALDAGDAGAWTGIGDLLEMRQEFAAALEAYRKAAAIEPSAYLDAHLAAGAARARDARLPAEFKLIASAPQITRGELAALIGIGLEPLLRSAAAKQVVATDIRSHWAAPWITAVLNAGVMDVYDNHTFQPLGRVRRGDLAKAVSRVIALAAQRRPDLREKMTQRPKIADMSATHLDYPAAAVAVSAGVLPLVDGKFLVSRGVSGAEAQDAIARLQQLADLR